MIQGIRTPMGLTVARLREWLAGIPAVDDLGQDREVFILTDLDISSPCVGIGTLNMDTSSTDVLLIPANIGT